MSLNAGDCLNKYPHQLSGGQLQRLLVARALLLDIRLLVADEIISMLDASTRIDVLNLLGDLKARGLGILFITHDLSLGNYISDRTVILRRGRVVEMGGTQRVFGNPLHPYTRMLLASVPQLHRKWESASTVRRPRTTRAASSSRSRRTTSWRSRRARDRGRAVAGGRAAIPWEERPPGSSAVLWRSSRNPIVGAGPRPAREQHLQLGGRAVP